MTASKVPEIRMALFGQSASGKTTLLSSYFGNQQRNSFEEIHGYRLVADDISVGNQLLARYYRMEKGEFPLGTEQFVEYEFGMKIRDLPESSLRIVWYDYPGGWWERSPKDASEAQARRAALAKLLTCHVGIILIDGMRYQTEGLPYVWQLLDQFTAEARRISDDFAADGQPLSTFPKEWILAVSKADLLPDELTAEAICKNVIAGAADQIAGVGRAVNATSFGHQFLLLSAVQGDGSRVVDAHRYVGLQLVAPVAVLSVLAELLEDADKGTIYGVPTFIMERLAALTELVDGLDDFLPRKYQILTKLLKALDLKSGFDKGAEYFRAKQMAAAKRGKSLEAVAATMQAEFASPEARQAFFRNQR